MPERERHARPDPRVGLCQVCRYVKLIENRQRSVFYFCERSRIDDRFPRYPRLPVLDCAGFDPAAGTAEERGTHE